MPKKQTIKMNYITSVPELDEKISKIFEKNRLTTTVMFIDMADSTLYKIEKGNESGWRKTLKHNWIVRKIVERFKGIVVKEIGDAVMIRFDDPVTGPNSAVQAAMSIQEELTKLAKEIPDVSSIERIQSKIGIAYSENDAILIEKKDIIGPSVDIAARISKIARPTQILTTENIYLKCETKTREKFSKGKETELKGISGKIKLYEVNWGEGFKDIRTVEDAYSLNTISMTIELLRKEIKEMFYEGTELIKNCRKYGVVDILPPKRLESDYTLEIIKNYLMQYLDVSTDCKRVLKLYGIAHRDFFHPGSVLFKILEENAGREQSLISLNVKAILMDPRKRATKIRACVESGQDIKYIKKSVVFEDLRNSIIGGIKTLLDRRKNPKFNLEIKFSGFLAQLWFIITDEFVFFEPYHIGRDVKEKEYFCLGGTVPIIRAERLSPYYKYFDKHFEFLWNIEGGKLNKYFEITSKSDEIFDWLQEVKSN